MKQRNVEPNEVTYTCLMNGFGRLCRIDLATRTFQYMESRGIRPSAKMYNALIAGLVSETKAIEIDGRVDTAMSVLRNMMRIGILPNCQTVSSLVDALGRCRIPRISEARAMVEKLEQQRSIPGGDAKVVTSIVRICGKAGDLHGVLEAFKTLKVPDTVAVNVFMDSCCRCNQENLATKAFDAYFRKKSLVPDVISYSVLIGSCLKGASAESRTRARALYQEMKCSRKIQPDNGLIDVVLKAMVRHTASHTLEKLDVQFIDCVIKDAEALDWSSGQLDRRKRVVRALLADRNRGLVWRKEDSYADSRRRLPSESDDELFVRKGWNKVDSGFRLWGGGGGGDSSPRKRSRASKANPGPCTFLESHGWNDVDSSFRLF
jgi:pentatricopeptide repeat protein